MRVLRLNLHFDLLSGDSLTHAIRELADYLEQPIDLSTVPAHICMNYDFDAFRYNRSLGCRVTGSAAICVLENGKPWMALQNDAVDLKMNTREPIFIIVK